MNAINEAIANIEDSRMHRMGGIQCGLDLWNVSICSSLLTNSSSWSGMEEHHVQELEDFQLLYLRRLFQVPKSTPKPSLLYDSDAMKMKYRVHKGILNLVKHISQLDEEDLANEVLQEQRKHSWPGLSKEAENIANDLDIDGLYDGHISKK